jgi:hypothetical protein
VAGAGDTVEVAAGTYAAQTVPGGTKAVTFKGGTDVIVRSMVVDAQNVTFDGINIDANNQQVLGVQFGGANSTFKNASIGRVVDEKGMLATSSCVGCTIDNVRFHDVLVVTDGVHNECLYSQAANITIANSHFSNCATMDVFFTRGTWWGQPLYGGWTLTNNFFGAPRFLNGQCCHYYAVYWAYQSIFDRAVVRGNRFESQVTADGTFTNSVESCNTPAFNLPGMTKEACGSTPTPTPTPTPSPSPTATPAPTTTPAPTPTADTQAPSVPQGMAWTTKTSSSIGLRWDASSDNRGVAGYRVYRNDVPVATTTDLSNVVSSLTCSTSYTIGLTAFDAAGNESVRAEATGTTSTEACPPAPTPTPTPTATPSPTPTATPSPTPTPTPSPAPTPAPSADLVGAWNFNETTGSALDRSSLGNHGTISGATRVAAGKFGRALKFDGVNDFVSVADKASLDLTKGMTIEAWVNPTRLTGHRTVAFKEHRAAGHQAYSLYASEGSSKPSAEVGIGSTYSAQTSSQTIPANAWTHVATTFDGTTLRVYRNGVQVGSKALAGSLTATSDPLKFGGNAVWSEFFEGTLDEIRVWKVARTAAQVQSDMNSPIA